VRKYHLDHGVVSFAGLSIQLVLWDFVSVIRQTTMRQITIRRLPDARLKILPGCAHVPQLQSPELFLATIGDFLEMSDSAPS
jgi:hypothetical protein